MLVDRFGRVHDYLRISITERCNLSCVYCLPNGDGNTQKHTAQMSADEIARIAHLFVQLGVKKIRLTGGEPMLRKDFSEIAQKLSELPVALSVTTNGVLLDRHLETLKKNNFKSLNVSLDTLDSEKFSAITQTNAFRKVWDNICLALASGFALKLNVVAMRGWVEEELLGLVELTEKHPLQVRFIEVMPFDGNGWKTEHVATAHEMLALIGSQKRFSRIGDEPNGTSRNYRLVGAIGTFGFISTMSEPFCATCNRLRVTADGKIKNCLFGKDELDLLTALRMGKPLLPIIEKSLFLKHEKLGGQWTESFKAIQAERLNNRPMIAIGG